MSSTNQSKRKPRRPSNGYLNIDDVTEPPGEDYENWIRITKSKLKERESKYMAIRLETLEKIICKQCKLFEKINSINDKKICVYNYNKIISNNMTTKIVSECLNKLHYSIELWNGLNLAKTTKSLSTFRKYFAIGKCWFDKKKKNILAPVFWIKIFEILETFSRSAATKYLNEYSIDNNNTKLMKIYSNYLLIIIIEGIFAGQLNFASTKPQPLIPCGILKESNPMKQYLLNLHPLLNIQLYINNGNQVNAKDLLQFVNKKLSNITTHSHKEFQDECQKVNPSKIDCNPLKSCHNNNNKTVHVNNNHISSKNSNYKAIHTQSQPVRLQRYNPIGTSPIGTGSRNNPSLHSVQMNPLPAVVISNRGNNIIYNNLVNNNIVNNNTIMQPNLMNLMVNNNRYNNNNNMSVNLNNLNNFQLQLLYIALSLK